LRRVAFEEEIDESTEEVVRVSVAEEFRDSFEGHDPTDRLDNNPEIRERLRTFHAV
jgi:hypothetical protein